MTDRPPAERDQPEEFAAECAACLDSRPTPLCVACRHNAATIGALVRERDQLFASLNEARAATVDANIVVAGLLEELAGAALEEREACASVANNFRRANRTGNAIAAAIRARGAK